MRSVLFDLDGTLLGLDLERFLPHYFDELVRYASGRLQLTGFQERLVAGVQAMFATREGPLTNREAFRLAFYNDPSEETIVEPVFERFYEEVFPSLRSHVEVIPAAAGIVAVARRYAQKVALATNPLFPRRAVEERIRWAGLDPGDFDLITSFETSHYAKPDPRYYVEVAKELGIHPESAIMIGNDRREDGAAKAVGMAFWLVRGPYTLDRHSPYPPDREGTLEELTPALEGVLRGL
jgi:FMN phosphatase YigB (HAD superfamily)